MANKKNNRATQAEQKRKEQEQKRKAQEQQRKEQERQRAKKELTESDGTRTKWETIRWIGGLILLFFSLYVFVGTCAHLFVWERDLGVVMADSAPQGFEYANACGKFGAHLGHALIGASFGLFGLLIPIIGMLLGVVSLIERSRVLWRTIISMVLVAIFGSLTLAACTGADGCFGSGWGGAYGIAIEAILNTSIGGMGVVILLIVCWILTGIIINFHFIDFLKSLAEGGVKQSKGALNSLVNLVKKRSDDEESVTMNEDDGVEEEDTVRIIGGTTTEDDDDTDEDDETYEEYEDDEEESNETEEQTEEPKPSVEPEQETPTESETTPESVVEEPVVAPEQEPETVEDELPKTNIEVVEVHEHTEKQLSVAEVDKHRPFDPDSTPDYKFPSVDYLFSYENGVEVSNDEIEQNKQRIEETLGNFGVPIVSMTATIGPTVTLYEIVQEAGVKIARVKGLESDIAQSLKALGIRIIAPIPGKGTIGIEVPNRNKETVSMRSAIQSERFQKYKAELPVVVGRTIQNENFVFDLAKMPHMLVAGATGQGKSVGLNAIITSLLYRKDPSQLKFVLIDPKTVEFSLYAKLEKHFLAKMASEDEAIVKDPKKAVYTLNSLVVEMENRLAKCGKVGVRNIVEYNDMVRQRKIEEELMPYIVVIIDEFADLIMTAKEVEVPVMRLAQKARAIGIHLIVATQRPDVKVITGGIKANFPARIAFRVMQMTDSRTIIDQPGANQLIGRGDMLFLNGGELTRVQCAFVDTPEVRDIVEHIAEQPFPFPTGTYLLPDYEDSPADTGSAGPNFGGGEGGAPVRYDEHFAEVARDAVACGHFSTSHVQSVYNVGFNRAGRITRQLEQAGIIGPANGSKPRDVKIYDMESLDELLQKLGLE